MRLGQLISSTSRSYGGPVRSLAVMCGELCDSGVSVTVLTVTLTTDGERFPFDRRVELVEYEGRALGGFRWSPRMCRAVGRRAAELDILHSHGLWTDVNRCAARAARVHRAPHLISPCGMLAPKALRFHAWKKLPVRLWFQQTALARAECLHAKSESEMEDLRTHGLKNPIALIPNPVAGPRGSPEVDGISFKRELGFSDDLRCLLYLGRVHPVKGAARLAVAWASLKHLHAEWRLVIAGPDENDYRREVEEVLVRNGCRGSYVFTGELGEARKWAALAAADLFVAPSDFENFGTSIAEAMLAGVPVITTTGTPWIQLRQSGSGWWIRPTVESLREAMREAMQSSEGRLRDMARRAREIVRGTDAPTVAGKMLQTYRWMLGEAPRPDWVHSG